MYDLKKLYAHILKNDIYVGKSQLNEIYGREVLNEAYTRPIPEDFIFTQSSTVSEITSWDELQKGLFESKKTGSGRGEYSTAALLMSRLDPVLYNKFTESITANGLGRTVLSFVNYADTKEMIQGGSVSFDVAYPDTDLKYEVKEFGETKKGTVRTGKEGYKVALPLIDKIRSNVKELYKKYSSLSPETQNIINQDKITKLYGKEREFSFQSKKADFTLGTLLEQLNERVTAVPNEFPRSMFFSEAKDMKQSIPCLALLPELISKLHKNPQVKEAMPEEAEWLRDIYKINDFKARYLDAYIRGYLNVDVKSLSPEVQLSDFLLYCMTSIFKDQDTYKKEVQNYFIPGTEEHKKALSEVFPVTGAFTVSPVGYRYTGMLNLEQGIYIAQISQAAFKVGRTSDQGTVAPDVGAP